MILTVVKAIKEQAEKIKGVKSFKYEGQDLINAQNNNSTIQFIVESDVYVEYLVTKDLTKITFNINILDKVHQGDDLSTVQNNALKIGVVLVKLLERYYKNVISVYDYSFMTLDRYTDDVLAGVRLTLMLIVPSLVNECNIDEYIDEENKYDEYIDKDITINIPTIDINNIDIAPKALKRNKKK